MSWTRPLRLYLYDRHCQARPYIGGHIISMLIFHSFPPHKLLLFFSWNSMAPSLDHHSGYQYNNNNKAFKSQTSWSRLELKPSRSNQGPGTWIAIFQALLSKAKSLSIFHPFESSFIASTQVNFGLPLPLFTLLSWLRIPLRTGGSGGLRWTCPNHLNRCWTNFSSIGATPNLSRISSFRTRSLRN